MYGMNGREAYLHRLGQSRRINRIINTPVNTNHPLELEDTTELDVENTTELDVENTTELDVENTTELDVENTQNKIEFNAKEGRYNGK